MTRARDVSNDPRGRPSGGRSSGSRRETARPGHPSNGAGVNVLRDRAGGNIRPREE